MKREMKRNVVSAALGVAIAIPLVMYAANHPEPKVKVQKESNAVVVELPEIFETTSMEAETTTEYIEASIVEEQAVEVVANPLIKCGWADIELSMADFNLLCATVYCETGHQSIDTQILAALCILNRVNMPEFPNSIYEVVYQPGAFEVAEKCNLWATRWDEATEMAVTYALEENNHPKNLTCFNLGYYHSFGSPYCNIGQAYFTCYTP